MKIGGNWGRKGDLMGRVEIDIKIGVQFRKIELTQNKVGKMR